MTGIQVEIGGQWFRLKESFDISIPMRFNEAQPATYGAPSATAQACEIGSFVGDVRRGGACNFETYTITPHCNGTHTECVGHITKERISLYSLLPEPFCPATLVSVKPKPARDTTDTYEPVLAPTDLVITKEILSKALDSMTDRFLKGLVIRTYPNEVMKRVRDYAEVFPPFFTLETMEYIRSRGVEHLVVDFPSVDRLFDEGKLRNHRIFWDIKPGVQTATKIPQRTITEMVYAKDDILDGVYFMFLSFPPFVADAAPSRVLLYSLSAD